MLLLAFAVARENVGATVHVAWNTISYLGSCSGTVVVGSKGGWSEIRKHTRQQHDFAHAKGVCGNHCVCVCVCVCVRV